MITWPLSPQEAESIWVDKTFYQPQELSGSQWAPTSVDDREKHDGTIRARLMYIIVLCDCQHKACCSWSGQSRSSSLILIKKWSSHVTCEGDMCKRSLLANPSAPLAAVGLNFLTVRIHCAGVMSGNSNWKFGILLCMKPMTRLQWSGSTSCNCCYRGFQRAINWSWIWVSELVWVDYMMISPTLM